MHQLGSVIGQVEQRLREDPQNTLTAAHTEIAALLKMRGATTRQVSSVCFREEHRHNDSHVEIRCNTAGDHPFWAFKACNF